MKSLADALPPEIAAHIHPDWRANEAEYWNARESVRAEYDGLWVAFARGGVIASGRNPTEVLHAGAASGLRPFVTRVGAEHEPCRMRRVTFAYDTAYPNHALPQMAVEFRAASGVPGVVIDKVIPDTGADASALPWADCQALGLDLAQGDPGVVVGVGTSSILTVTFPAWVWLDGREYPCRLQAELTGGERILGRDVLNCVDVLFRGPAGEVVVNP